MKEVKSPTGVLIHSEKGAWIVFKEGTEPVWDTISTSERLSQLKWLGGDKSTLSQRFKLNKETYGDLCLYVNIHVRSIPKPEKKPNAPNKIPSL